MFGNSRNNFDSKVDVLESKLNIYEQLSREMISKLEVAVEKMSEGNSRIASILVKHDEKIEQNIKSDELIVKMIDELKESNEREHNEVSDRMDKIETSIDELFKFRWQIGGITALVLLIVTIATSILPNFLQKSVDNHPQMHYNDRSHS